MTQKLCINIPCCGYKEYYLAGLFAMVPWKEMDNLEWQFDFYHDGNVISYIQGKQADDPSPTLGQKELRALGEIEHVIDVRPLLQMYVKMNDEFPSRAILQLHNTGKVIWNVSLITDSFQLIRLEVDAYNGEIISQRKEPLIKF